MHRTSRTPALLVPALLLASAAATAAPARLSPAAAADLAPRATVASDAPSTAPVSGPVRFTWPIDQAAEDLAVNAPHRAESTGHTRTVTGASLRRGVTVAVNQPGALLKLSPRPGRSVTGLVVEAPGGRLHGPGDGLRALPGDADAYVLDPALGAGAFVVRAVADADVHLDVRERGSDVVLFAQAAADVVFAGDVVRVRAGVTRGGQPVSARIGGRLLDPAGKRRADLVRGPDGALQARLPARAADDDGALWSVELTADASVDGVAVQRTVTTAFAVSVPTARFTGAAEVDADRLRIDLGLDVASASRYAATAVLYGTNREGASQPIAVAQSADELGPGRRWLTLEFDAAAVAASGMSAPFELRDLRLVDQGRVQVLHRQARGLPVAAR